MCVVYSRTYRNVSADALTRNSVDQIEEWALVKGFAWIEIPDIWGNFGSLATPDNLSPDTLPICFSPRSDPGLHAVEWNPIGYHARNSMLEFGIKAFKACARHSFDELIAADEGNPVWTPSLGATLLCGPGKTEHDLHDFTYLSSSNNFTKRIFILQPHINVSEIDIELWDTMGRVDSALPGAAMASKWIVRIRGNLTIPELGHGHGWRPLGTIGMRCHELGISLECTDKQPKRIRPISDSVWQFFFPSDGSGREITTSDSHISSLAISKLRVTPRVWPVRLGGVRPLSNREVIRALGGSPFWTSHKGGDISEHIATDELWRSTPSVARYWVFRQYTKISMEPSGVSSRGVGARIISHVHRAVPIPG